MYQKYCIFFTIMFLCFVTPVVAKVATSNPVGAVPTIDQALTNADSSPSAEASMSAGLKEATPAAITKKVVKKEPDITEPKPEIQGKLEQYLADNPPGPLNPFNFISHGIINAVEQGVPANTLVLILLFPLIATVVVFARHIIGLKSFGIFTPALLSVAFLTTGLVVGISLFVLIIFTASVARGLMRKMRIQYLPRMGIFMWFISMVIFVTLLVSPSLGLEELITLGIFPILILILLAENYIDVQITRNFPQAMMMTIETLLVATVCYFLMNMEDLQKFVLVYPEIFSVTILGLIALIEQYSGLRLLEIWRFRKILWK